MGKSKTKTKPIYEAEVKGAANTLTGAYNQAAPGIQANASAISGLVPGLIDRYKNGDPVTNAAKGYTTDVLSGKYLDEGNPYLQDIVDRTNNSVKNQSQAALGLKGLTGGSDYAGLIADRLAANETGLRYQNYGDERASMDAAAGRAPAYTAADQAMLDQVMAAANASLVPLQAAGNYSSGIGGLLGQYTKTTQKQGLGGMLAGLAGAGLSGWASGGFGGFGK